MDITTLSLAKKYANKVAAGFSKVEVQENNLIFTLNDGTKATMTIPIPEGGSGEGIDLSDYATKDELNTKVNTADLGYKTITSPDMSLLDKGLYIYIGDEAKIAYGDIEGTFYLRYGSLLYYYKYNSIRTAIVITEDGMWQVDGYPEKPFLTVRQVAYTTQIPPITYNDIKRWNSAGNVSSDVINSIRVVDALPEVEEEGILYLIKEPSIEYIVNPAMEMGDISRDGSLSDSTEYCRTADYVYVYGKNNITITNGLGVISRVLCYDANKNFMTNWYADSAGTTYSYKHVEDGSNLDIPEGCYYIKIRFASTKVKPVTIGYNN